VRRLGLATVALITVMVLALAQGSLAKQKLQVMVTSTGDYGERMKVFWKGFEEANPDISVELIPGPGNVSAPEEKLAVMVAAGIPPDLARLGDVKPVAASGLLQDITPLFQTLPASVRNDIWPILFDDLSYDGRIYALPLGTVVSMYYYNKLHFEERGIMPPNADWSWEQEGISELKKLSVDLDGDGLLDRWGIGLIDGGAGREAYPFIYSAGGGPLFSEDGTKFLANTPITRDALQYLQDLAQVHQAMRTTGGWSDFPEQRVSSLLWGSFMVGFFLRYPDFDWDFALRPTFRGGRGSNIWSETPFGIPVGAKQPELAWRALQFVVSTEGQVLSMNLGWGTPPIRRSVTVGPFLQHYRDKNVASVAEMISSPLNQIIPTQVPLNVRLLLQSTVLRPVILGQKAPGQALDEATPQIEAIMNQ